MRQPSTFLSLANVSKRFGAVTAINDITLQINRGEFVSFLGPSGCGKTTTLRMIAGFIRPDDGEISAEGRILSSAAEFVAPEQRNLGMVFQSYAVWPHMTVRQNIELPLRARRFSPDQVRTQASEAIRLCRLTGLEDRDPLQLSGGQLQRVALARALAYRPPLILLDEPLSNLDIALREQLRTEIHRLHRATGATFVLVTHDQVEAMSLSDRIVVMNRGYVEQIGPPEEIYRKPKTTFVAKFVGSANLLRGVVGAPYQRDDGDKAWNVQIGQLTFPVRAPHGLKVGSAVTLALHPESLRIIQSGTGVQQASPTETMMPGYITAIHFLGRIREFTVDVDGMEWRVAQIRTGNPPKVGDRVQLAVSHDSIVAVSGGAEVA